MNTAEIIKKKRLGMGLTQAEFANLLGLGVAGERTVRGWENAEHHPTVSKLNEIKNLPDHSPYSKNISEKSKWMASHTRGLQTLIIRNKAKRPLLAQIKPEDSIAALEKQLDLVTQLVITLSASLPAAQVPNWLAALTTMMSQSSATQFMGDDAAVSDIAATKAVIRKLQTTYFNLRQVTP